MLKNLIATWYSATTPPVWARALAWAFGAVSALRRALYQSGVLPRYRAPVPVIVVGNLTVGGTGKTPLVVWLVTFLQTRGFRPGIVSRGYGGRATQWPQTVTADSDPALIGDEAVLMAQATGVPVAAAPKRAQAVQRLLRDAGCDIIVCDDGLQHYALARDVEIVVVDGRRRWGNGYLLPAGPLREPVARAQRADFVLVYGDARATEFSVSKRIAGMRRLGGTRETTPLAQWRGRRVHAVAGIGHPQQFFEQLQQAGLDVVPHAFADHHAYRAADVTFSDDVPVVMTEKDAVKCRAFALPNAWSAVLDIEPDARWLPLLERRVQELKANNEGAIRHG